MRKKGDLGTSHMHKSYQQTYGVKVDKARYTKVVEAFNRGLVQLLLEGKEIKLPFRMGTFYISKNKVNYDHLKLDYGHYRKTGEKLFHTNRHSDGFHARFHWRKFTAVLPGKTVYKFIPARQNCRALAVAMKEPGGHKKFVQYQPMRHAAH